MNWYHKNAFVERVENVSHGTSWLTIPANYFLCSIPPWSKQTTIATFFRLYYALLFCFHNFEEDTKLKSCTEATSILNAHDNTVCARNCGTLQNCIYLRIPRWYHKYVVPTVPERFKRYEIIKKVGLGYNVYLFSR